MTGQNENQRVRITKLLMKDALRKLLQQKPLTSISVTAVCNTAGVHRSTFYKYYTDPGDLLRDIEQDFLNRIPALPETLDEKNLKQLLEANAEFFEFVIANKKAFQVLFDDSSGSIFAKRLVELLCSSYIPVPQDMDEQSARFLRLYITSGTVGMFREWINEDFPVSSEEIAEMMYSYSVKVNS